MLGLLFCPHTDPCGSFLSVGEKMLALSSSFSRGREAERFSVTGYSPLEALTCIYGLGWSSGGWGSRPVRTWMLQVGHACYE